MEETLSKFVEQTGADRGLARDLLLSTQWNYESALKSFQDLALGSVASNTENSPTKQEVKTRNQSAKSGKLRGISVVNTDIVFEARNKVIKGDILGTDERYEHFEEMPNYTFVLPDLSKFPEEMGDFLRRDLIETSTLVSLEQADVQKLYRPPLFWWNISAKLNWWADMGIAQRLVPLATSGDGNCLLHAASLGMWGFHDRLLTLRKALFRTLTGGLANGAIKRRWRFQQWDKNMEAGGLIYSEVEWEQEWGEILRIASTQRRPSAKSELPNQSKLLALHSLASIDEDGEEESDSAGQEDQQKPQLKKDDLQPELAEARENERPDSEGHNEADCGGAYESLEEIHVFVLAHVLRRPIIVVSDTMLLDFSGDPIAPIPFGGIYLPLECPPENCFKCPLLLTFDAAHFSALVACENQKHDSKKKTSLLTAIPVVGPSFDLLPIHYAVDPGPEFDWSTLDQIPSTKDKLELAMQRKLELLRKYLDIVELKVPCSTKKAEKPLTETPKSEVKSHNSGTDEKNTRGVASGGSDKSLEQNTAEGNGIDIKSAAKKVSDMGTWLGNQLVKVGNLAGVIGGTVHTTVYAAKVRTDRKPDYYDKMIDNYISSAGERFEEEKREQDRKKASGPGERPQPCLTPGCQLYGTAATSYLCTGCHKLQMKEVENYASTSSTTANHSNSTFQNCISTLPCVPYTSPPSYSESCGKSQFYSPAERETAVGVSATTQRHSSATTHSNYTSPLSVAGHSSVATGGSSVDISDNKGTMDANQGISRCLSDGCEFYGSPQNDGFCSTCFKKHKQTLLHTAKQHLRKDS